LINFFLKALLGESKEETEEISQERDKSQSI